MAFDSFIDSLGTFGAWLGLIPQERSSNHDHQACDRTRPGQKNSSDNHQSPPPGFFTHANNFTVISPVMVEGTVNMLANGNSVMHHLVPHMDPNATVDSSARWPPPSCHPGTRVTVSAKLTLWLDDPTRQWSVIWLYGSAGCGKSAIAQTFAEKCDELGRLGAAFFFSRPNKRNNPKTVIPTISYQLAAHCSEYKSVITSRIADDPQLLSKSIPVQFKKLIIEPLTYLQNHRHESVQQPFLILLDGLDECEGEAAQCDFVKLINEVVRVKKDLPLLWLICSRPEAHLQHTFTRIIDCGREELVIDEECRNDVDRYLRDGFFEFREKYSIGASWPSEEKFDAVSKGGSGHFVFAATALGFIGDEDYANPVERLDKLVAFLQNAERDGVTNPLAKLDLLYTSILSDIPRNIFPTTWRILAHFIYAREIHEPAAQFLFESAQVLCNFINVDQSTFYGALRKLYSIIAVPTPEEAATNPLRFYHASFQDFLVDRSRSGNFVIERKQALIDIIETLFFWHEIDSGLFHTADGPWNSRNHDHESLPGLKWTSGVDIQRLSKPIAQFSEWCWHAFDASYYDSRLFSCVLKLDPRYLFLLCNRWVPFVNAHYEMYPSGGFYRTEPSDEFDVQLLDYLKMMTNQESIKPASFPLAWNSIGGTRLQEYILVGHGAKSVVIWYTHSPRDFKLSRLNCDQAPSPDHISDYQAWLNKIEWYVDNGTELGGDEGKEINLELENSKHEDVALKLEGSTDETSEDYFNTDRGNGEDSGQR